VVKEIHFPHSLGLLHSTLTYYIGFKINSSEYKVMGLAPYGEPKYVDLILDNLIDLKDDGTFRLNQAYFDYCTGLTVTNRRFDDLFGAPPRQPDKELLTRKHMDIAAQHQETAQCFGLPPASPGNHRSGGNQAGHALIFNWTTQWGPTTSILVSAVLLALLILFLDISGYR